MTFRIAIIGCGWVSNACHGPAYKIYSMQHPDVELAACCDVDAEKAEKFRIQFGFRKSYRDHRVMLDVERPDAVCLNVPEPLICPLGCSILEAGFPLLCEKPPGLCLEETDRLIASARKGRAIHQVAFNRRYTPLINELKRRLNQRPIDYIQYDLHRFGRLKKDFSTTAIHAIDVVRYLLNSDYQDVRFHYLEPNPGRLSYILEGTLVCGTMFRICAFPTSGVAVERATVLAPDSAWYLACNIGFDTPGWLRYYESGKLIEEINGADLSGTEEDYILNGFFAEDVAFFEAVRSGEQTESDFVSARQSVEIMQCLRERRSDFHMERSGQSESAG